MKTLRINLIIAVAVFALMLTLPMAQAQDKEIHKKSVAEKTALKNFFNTLGDLAMADDKSPELSRKASADLIRSLGYLAAEQNGNDGEENLMVRDFFLDLGNLIEAGEDSEMAPRHVSKFIRGIGKIASKESGNLGASKLMGLIADAVETDGFGKNEKLEKEFVKNLFNVLGDIAIESIDDMDEDEAPAKK